MTVQSHNIICFGMGYVAQHLTRTRLGDDWYVYGTSRTREAADDISERVGAHMLVMQAGDGDLQPDRGSHWLISIPPNQNGCPAFQAAGKFASTAKTITYLSTTGVYGDHDGAWVFEDTPVSPGSDRATSRVVAENQWRELGANIVRLPGIYGPGRSVLDRLKDGRAQRINKPGQVFSRCHVDDIAAGLKLILDKNVRGATLHFCDEEPAPPQDVVTYGADLLGIDAPEEVAFRDAKMSDMARSFYSECKRVSNVRTKLKLGWEPQYPTYREGLTAILFDKPDR